ncbi:hypothetical protein LCGC14_1154570 [marine sediment metagenome]|uniref:Uncharacterized protein n=1 Tax=marine sediment metagenome TaxID=412755 RepID=A0A0F9LZF8_9ZZZZ
MKISELIKKLENIKIDRGDLKVKFDIMGNFYSIDEIYINDKDKDLDTVILGG